MSVVSIGILIMVHCALHKHIHSKYSEISNIWILNNARVRIEYYIYTYLKSKYK